MGELEDRGSRATHEVSSASEGRVVLKLGGELDMSTVESIREAAEDAIAQATDVLVLDLGDLEFADSSAIALWVSWSKRVPRLEIHQARPMIRRVIEAMGLTTTLNPS